MSRLIEPVKNNYEKQQTYAENKAKYNRAMKYGFYYETLLIDYAMMEDRLRSFIYHIGGLKTRKDYKIGKGYVHRKLSEIVNDYKDEKENNNLGINSDRVEDAQIGISFPIGILIASYMFESKDVKGELVFSRNKWEYRGDASESTRIALHVDPDIEKWEVYSAKGYEKYDM